MPSRNVLKTYEPESFYHVYARSASKKAIFRDALDYEFFSDLFKRYLSDVPVKDKTGEMYPHHYELLELLAYCLMTNHFHLLV